MGPHEGFRDTADPPVTAPGGGPGDPLANPPAPQARANTLGAILDPRHNSLNALRLLAASLVIVGHAPLILGIGQPYAWADLDVGGWAVAAFFGISGWLITGSRLTLPFGAFLWRRLLRIMPAFWTVLIVTALVLAPISALKSGDWSPTAALRYVVTDAFLWIVTPVIHGTLTDNPDATWNLSLWTLFWEMCCYLGVGIVLTWQVARRKPAVIASLWVLFTVATTVIQVTEVVRPGSAPGQAMRLGSYFLAGAMLRMLADRVPARPAWAGAAIGAIAVLCVIGRVGALGGLPIAYLCIYLGAVLSLKAGRRNDISYGVYVYAFPAGQLIVAFFGTAIPVVWFIVINLALVLPFAWGSWLAVEKPALRLKRLVSPAPRTTSAPTTR